MAQPGDADVNNLKKDISKSMAKFKPQNPQKDNPDTVSAERAEASAMQHEADSTRIGAEMIARALAESGSQNAALIKGMMDSNKTEKPSGEKSRLSPAWIVVVFLAIFVAVGIGVPPIVTLILFVVLLFAVCLTAGFSAVFEKPFLFWLGFAVWSLLDANQSYSGGANRYTSLFAFGIVFWLLFVKPGISMSWANVREILLSLGACIGAGLLYGLIPTLLYYATKVGVSTGLINTILVMLPIVGLAFLLPGCTILEGLKKALLVLLVVALVMYAYNAGLSQSLVNIGFERGAELSTDWGAGAKDFFNFFITPIKDASTRFYTTIWPPACYKIMNWMEGWLFFASRDNSITGGPAQEFCPPLPDTGAKNKQQGSNQPSGGISGWLDRRIAFATGQVEETKAEPPGVTLSKPEPQSSAVEHQPVSVRSNLRAVALDKPIEIDLFCKAIGQKSNVSSATDGVQIIPSRKINVMAKEKADTGIVCLFKSLEAQTYSFLLSATFNFRTASYLKMYFATDEQISSLGKGDSQKSARDAWFDRYKITDKSPEPKYTPGPVSMGVRIEETEPIILYSKNAEQKIFLNIPVKNAYSGRIRSINRLFIIVPGGLEVEGVYGGKEKGIPEKVTCLDLPPDERRGCSADLNFNIYDITGLKLSEKESAGFEYRAILNVVDYASLLGTAPPSTQYARVIFDYDYVLEQRSGGLTVEKGAMDLIEKKQTEAIV